MRMFVIGAALAAALAIPATGASAQRHGGGYYGNGSGYGNGYGYGRGHRGSDVRDELRECRRELRRARTRWEYQRELRECRRELAEARRDQYRDGRYRRGYRNDRNRYRSW
jgi:opacity protein-like surface antigen